MGKVTEVGLFTDKLEIKKTDMSEAEIDAKLKEKLAKFIDVSDADIIDVQSTVPEPKKPDEQDLDPDNPDA